MSASEPWLISGTNIRVCHLKNSWTVKGGEVLDTPFGIGHILDTVIRATAVSSRDNASLASAVAAEMVVDEGSHSHDLVTKVNSSSVHSGAKLSESDETPGFPHWSCTEVTLAITHECDHTISDLPCPPTSAPPGFLDALPQIPDARMNTHTARFFGHRV